LTFSRAPQMTNLLRQARFADETMQLNAPRGTVTH